MNTQLSLPALWARLHPPSNAHPADQLRRLDHDVVDTKAEIRKLLDALAARHDVRGGEVNRAMAYADDMLSDLVHEVRRELEHELERPESLED